MPDPLPFDPVKSTHLDQFPAREKTDRSRDILKIKVDHNVSFEKAKRRTSMYPFETMNPGDSFLAPKNIKITTIRTAAYAHAKKLNMKFASKRTEEGIRVWRIK